MIEPSKKIEIINAQDYRILILIVAVSICRKIIFVEILTYHRLGYILTLFLILCISIL